MTPLHPRVEWVGERHDLGAVIFASSRDTLEVALPEFGPIILDELDPSERYRPCWLACVDDGREGPAVVAGTDPIAGAPQWWLDLRQLTTASGGPRI